MVTFRETSSKTSPEEINEIGRRLGLPIPSSYVAHLLQFNGGRVSPNIFSFLEGGKWTESNVDWFLAVNGFDHNNLLVEIEAVKWEEKRMPSHMLPIAYDPGGNYVCISCGERDYGKVYFWDHEREVDYSVSGDDDYSNLYLIAEDFDQFLAGLH